MFHRHSSRHRRADFLGVMVWVVGFALLLTVAVQAQVLA
jgi:hypothetical protein